jgi:hypothetical protein
MWMVLVMPVASARAAEPPPLPKAPALKPLKPAKRVAKAARQPVPPAAPARELRLGLHGTGPHRHAPSWHVESVAPPGLNPRNQESGLRALALVSPSGDAQRVEFGVAPVVPLKLPTASATGPDGADAARSARKGPLPDAQLYLRYRW